MGKFKAITVWLFLFSCNSLKNSKDLKFSQKKYVSTF